jgi:ferritin-like metal-binding protein YciE
MATATENLITWLKDAHAMEQSAISIAEMQSKRLENYPRMKAKVDEHLEVTRRQADMVASRLEGLGADTSTTKDLMGRFTGVMNTLGSSVAADEAVKMHMADYAFEHLEIASYRILIAAAKHIRDLQTQRICEEILSQEEEMANWLGQELEEMTHTYLTRSEAGEPAKR